MVSVVIAIIVLLALCFLGVSIGIAALLVGVTAFALERGFNSAMQMSGQRILDDAMNYNLSVIPLFILMGVFIYRADVSTDLFRAAYRRTRGLRGGLAHSTVIACAAFAAVCGSSVATAATMTRVAMPSMRSFRYSEALATGSIGAGGTLGILIPPSVPLMIYGIIAQEDIGKLFMAGILPGIMLVLLFMLAISIWLWLRPGDAPSGSVGDDGAVTGSAFSVASVSGLFLLVLGGIYAGFFTPTEAAGIGATGAGAIAVFRGRMRKLADWIDVLAETARTTSALFLVIFGALVFGEYANYTGLPFVIVHWVETMQLGPNGLVLVIIGIAIIMGMFFEAIGILLLLVPVFLPSLAAQGIDLVWFGIIVVLVTELGLITPPVGMNIFVVKSVSKTGNLVTMFKGVMPFVGAILVALALLMLFPSIVTVLPDLMG